MKKRMSPRRKKIRLLALLLLGALFLFSGQTAVGEEYDSVEEALEQELQDFSDRIRYGNAHRGVDIEIDRMAEVPDKLIAQYDRVAGPLLKISRRLQKQVRQVLQDQRRGGRETGLLMAGAS